MDVIPFACFWPLVGNLIVILNGRGNFVFSQGRGIFTVAFSASEDLKPEIEQLFTRHHLFRLSGTPVEIWRNPTTESWIIEAKLRRVDDQTYLLTITFPALTP